MLYDQPIIAAIVLAFGFILLLKGADWLIRGSVTLARHIGVSELLIGMTVIAFGTSLPELMINLLANDPDANALAIGNILGANIVNIWLILGIAAIITPLVVHRTTVWREILFAVGAGLVMLALVSDDLIGFSGFHGLDRKDGIILLLLFGLFLYYIVTKFNLSKLQAQAEAKLEHKEGVRHPLLKSLVYVVVGAAGLALGGNFIVDSGVALADALNISSELVGLTIIALGTTGPELATSLSAVRQRKTDLAIGGVVGSTIFNTLWVLGLSSLWRPLEFDEYQLTDASVAAVAVVSLFLFLIFNRKQHVLTRTGGIMFLVFYIAYLFYLILRV